VTFLLVEGILLLLRNINKASFQNILCTFVCLAYKQQYHTKHKLHMLQILLFFISNYSKRIANFMTIIEKIRTFSLCYTELFKMIVGVLTTCHTQYT